MRTEYDLEEISKQLKQKHRTAKGLIRQIVGSYAIKNDLGDAENALKVFWKWHVQQVGPTRGLLGDAGEEGLIGRSIFCLVALRLTRAFDMGADGRARVDIRPAVRLAGLEGALNEITRFRDQELAHYGGFAHERGIFSDDRAVLVADSIEGSFVTAVWVRWNSERTLALKMDSVVKCATAFIDDYSDRKRALFLNLLKDDPELRREVLDGRPSNLFFSNQFFKEFASPPQIQQNGPSINVKWD